jgi:eukaryotic-like serine/threonine-protein kinase
MGRVFTITEGLENMGAVKTGGQGSVYKARRANGTISAVKILPTPIHSETQDDKHFTDFQNEVNKLKKVNREPNPHVVPILSSGLTESGSFPFIEMEFVEGPDLEELLHPPHAPIFTVKEATKVTEQLSDALAHCHRVGVKHGDVKSNNIKYNVNTGKYVLLDFGMAIMTDEQRRTSLRRAGAVEFMAPEQNEGQIFFETDVYSFGVIIFELLAGVVPFPLTEKGETARNNIILSHMEKPVPDILELRRKRLPASWTEEKRNAEMQVPEWLLTIVYRCLQKKREDRFEDGTVLNASIMNRTVQKITPVIIDQEQLMHERAALLARENEELRQQLARERQRAQAAQTEAAYIQPRKRSSGGLNYLWALLFLAALGTAFYFIDKYSKKDPPVQTYTEPTAKLPEKKIEEKKPPPVKEEKKEKLTEEQINEQLAEARRLIDEGEIEEGLFIYKFLAEQQVPEAMFVYGDMGLKKINTALDCGKSWDMVKKASDKKYPPAMRTIGFLHFFAENPEVLSINNYDQCSYDRNLFKGSKLMMEAVLAGDSVARRLVDELNITTDENAEGNEQ